MKTKALFITDQRMLDLMDYCLANEVSGITTQKEWCILVGIESANIANIKKGLRGFTPEQLLTAGKQFDVSMDYLFGFTDLMKRNVNKISAIENLKQAVFAIEQEIQGPKPKSSLKQKLKQKR